MSKAVCLVSGGMDSSVSAAFAKSLDYELALLWVNYGQRTARREFKAFSDLADFWEVKERLVIDLGYLKAIGGSGLVDENIELPLGEDPDREGIPPSYVPFRNANLLCIAVSWAEVIGASKIYIGAVAQDYSGYPDCRPEFYYKFNELIEIGTKAGVEGRKIEIVTPVIYMRKAEIVKKGIELGVPFELTWSCYIREDVACGECDSCLLRIRGFKSAGFIDPVEYAIEIDWTGCKKIK